MPVSLVRPVRPADGIVSPTEPVAFGSGESAIVGDSGTSLMNGSSAGATGAGVDGSPPGDGGSTSGPRWPQPAASSAATMHAHARLIEAV